MADALRVPEAPHRCAVLDPLGPYSRPREGSAFRCGQCGRGWVAVKDPPRPDGGQRSVWPRWVPEKARARRARERAERRAARRAGLDT